MKILTWNVNGLRACISGEFFHMMIEELKPDIVCLQETKAKPSQIDINVTGYIAIWNSSEREGYAGVLTLTKISPISIKKGLNNTFIDSEGRLIAIELEEFYVINVYLPMSQSGL